MSTDYEGPRRLECLRYHTLIKINVYTRSALVDTCVTERETMTHDASREFHLIVCIRVYLDICMLCVCVFAVLLSPHHSDRIMSRSVFKHLVERERR